jgi:hypothetical protein
MTNQMIDALFSTLGRRHYVLKSAYPRDERRFHVAVQPSRLNEYDLKFPGGFAFVLYKPKLPDTYGYVVIPHARVRGMFIEERRDAKDGGWNAYVTVEGRFRTSADRTGEIDVADCRGCWPLPQRILSLSRGGHGDAEVESALHELSKGTYAR